jgi:hypothetical protein
MKELIVTILFTVCFSIGIGWIFVKTVFEMLELMFSERAHSHDILGMSRKKTE